MTSVTDSRASGQQRRRGRGARAGDRTGRPGRRLARPVPRRAPLHRSLPRHPHLDAQHAKLPRVSRRTQVGENIPATVSQLSILISPANEVKFCRRKYFLKDRQF